MNKGSPSQARVPAIITWLLDAVDRWAFRDPDIDATACGWGVGRPRRFVRSYRDPRWNLVSVCPACVGVGAVGARPCAVCDGAGRIIADPAEHDPAENVGAA